MNPIQQIAAAVTPAVMVSACGLIALGLDNQAARMAARLRELAREWRELEPGNPRRALLAGQVRAFDRRHGFYFRALLLNYGALFAFVVTSLLWLLQAVWESPPACRWSCSGWGCSCWPGWRCLSSAPSPRRAGRSRRRPARCWPAREVPGRPGPGSLTPRPAAIGPRARAHLPT